jgi:SPP1 gp7 family putative phage head morphogenesis protein
VTELYQDALGWARQSRVVLPDEFYGRLQASARARAFSVAGISVLDALAAVQQSLDTAIAKGQTQAEWKQAMLADPQAIPATLMPAHRLDNIFRTNLQSAYMAGIARQQESPGPLRRRPFFQYDAINDSRTRPAHAAMDNYIAPADDPVWRTHTPPGGYRCRCVRIALTEAEAKARGWKGKRQPPPAEPDEGWAVHPLDDGQWTGITQAIDARLSKCAVPVGAYFSAAQFANRRGTPPLWCKDGPLRDNLLMQRLWAERQGEMPEPRSLDLRQLDGERDPKAIGLAFVRLLGGASLADAVDIALPSGDIVVASADLLKTKAGGWKADKRGRGPWIAYLAELIVRPQEVWIEDIQGGQKLYLLGRFQRGRDRLDAIAVFGRDGATGRWAEGHTAYVFDGLTGLDRKRQSLLTNEKASIRWLGV